jgi:hypothetical protein
MPKNQKKGKENHIISTNEKAQILWKLNKLENIKFIFFIYQIIILFITSS